MIHNSVKNGPLIWPTAAQENGTVRLKTYEELSDKEKLQADCDLKATNIVLQGLSPDLYALFNHHKIAKDIWERVKLLMQGISLSKQERECKLYDEFDKFSYMKEHTRSWNEMRIRSPDRLLSFPSGFPLGMVPPKNLDKRNSLVPHDSILTIQNSLRFFDDFQNSPDDEVDTRNSHEYLNDLEEEYQARALLVKSKRFFKKGTQRFSSAKATDQTDVINVARRVTLQETAGQKLQSPFQPKPLTSSQHKPELRPTKYFEDKYNKVKAKLALLSSSSSACKASMVKNKGLMAEAYKWD
nr:hypothetical protein [Tanacetum cinerariifolium]